MLLTFAIKNFKSFKEQQIFDLIATSGSEFSEQLFNTADNISVNRNTCIVGPNGSGKTHLLQAINCFAQAIKNPQGVKDAFEPFALDNDSVNQPTEYSALLYDPKNKEYINYSFAVNNGKVIRESLYTKASQKNAKQTKVFDRDIQQLNFATIYKKHEQLLTTTLDAGSLISNFAAAVKIDAVKFLARWATTTIILTAEIINTKIDLISDILFIEPLRKQTSDSTALQDSILAKLNGRWQQLGLPIANIELKGTEQNEPYLVIRPNTLQNKDLVLTIVEAKAFFSKGTFQTLSMVIALEVLSYGPNTLLIDEFDRNLHHQLSLAVLALIRRSNQPNDSNNYGSQSIMTSHNILLLDSQFRRDSIFLLEKDPALATVIHRANEFAVRKDAKISTKYLNNEFGALPKIFEGKL